MRIIFEPTREELTLLPEARDVRAQKSDRRVIHMHVYGSQVELYVAGYDCSSEQLYGCLVWTACHKAGWGQYDLPLLRRVSSESGESLVRNMRWEPRISSSVAAITNAYHHRGWWKRYS